MEIKDILGIEPIGEAGLEATKATIKGVSKFLELVFKPGLEELGYLIKDGVRLWRFPSSCSHEDEMSVCYIWWYNDTINEAVQKLNVIRKEVI